MRRIRIMGDGVTLDRFDDDAFGESLFFAGDAAEADCSETHITKSFKGGDDKPPPPVSMSQERLWQDHFAQWHVAAAIISVNLATPEPHHHGYMIGFDEAKNDPALTDWLLKTAEKAWARLDGRPSFSLRIAHSCVPAGVAESGSAKDRPLERFGHALVMAVGAEGAQARAIFFRANGEEKFTPKDTAALKLILPLIVDGAAGRAQLMRQSRRSEMLEAMFDRMSLATFMLDAHARPLFMNSAARLMIEDRQWLMQVSDGAIACADAKQSKQLRAMVNAAATAGEAGLGEGMLRLDGGSEEWRLVHIVPGQAKSAEGRQAAMLIVLTPGRMNAPASLLEALGLLPSEQRFLNHFLQASSLGDAALGSGLSEETARTYLKRVRAKLGVHRQMELAGLISGLVLPMAAPVPAGSGA